jgi:hypothetical protein
MKSKSLLAVVILLLSLGIVASASASPAVVTADPETDEVVLPTRVANAIKRTQTALDNAVEHVDEAEYTKAITSLRAVRANLARADKAARRQMNAVPADPEAETTPGPDSVIAALTLDQEVATTIVGLFNANTGTLVTALASTLSTAQLTRDRLLNTILALDPEGAGADYSDGMADTLDGYADEVANISEALSDDKLSTGGTAALRAALTRANATLNKLNTAYGGGE